MDDLYADIILDHYKHPKNIGSIRVCAPEAKLHHVHAANAGCGDSFRADLVVRNGVVTDMKWTGEGCAISTAAMSMVSEWISGKTMAEVRSMDRQMLLSHMGLEDISAAREKCLLLPTQLFLFCAAPQLHAHR